VNKSAQIILDKIYDLIVKNKIIASVTLLLGILIIFYFLIFSIDDQKVVQNLEEENQTIPPENKPKVKPSDQEDKETNLKKKTDKPKYPIAKNKPSTPKKSQKEIINSFALSPSKTLETLHNMLKEISRSKIDDNKIQKIISDTYDVNKMLALIIGDAWKNSEEKAKITLRRVFEEYISKNYIRRFASIKKLEFGKLEINKVGNNYQMAKTKLIINSNEEILISYLLNQDNKNWKIFDVLLDGAISEIATKKSEFESFTNKGELKPLIEALKKKNSTLLND